MANQIPMYETRTLLEAIKRMMPARTFLRDTFFNEVQTFVTENVDVDFQKEKRRVAPFVVHGGFTMDRQGFVTRNYKPPLVAPQRKLTVEDINTRSMGENIYSQRTPEQRQAERIADDLAFFETAITRREEIMCRDILTTGKCTIKGYVDDDQKNIVQDEINYGFNQFVTLSGADLWSAPTAHPYEDLKAWRMQVLKNSGFAPNIAIMSGNVVEKFILAEEIKSILNRNIVLGTLQPTTDGYQSRLGFGISVPLADYDGQVTFVGTLPGLGLEIYQYDEWYDDENGVTQPMIPDNLVILGKKNMGKRLYGAVTQMEQDEQFHTYEGQRVPKVWANINSDVRMIRTSARPLPAPDVIEDWLVATVM